MTRYSFLSSSEAGYSLFLMHTTNCGSVRFILLAQDTIGDRSERSCLADPFREFAKLKRVSCLTSFLIPAISITLKV
jgi:hypothetical protein